MVKLIEFLFDRTQKYFMPRITIIDVLVIGFIPYWVYLAFKWKPIPMRYAVIFLITLISLIVGNIIGGIIAVKYNAPGLSPLLPSYIIYEVFPFYWTLVNILSIGVGILPFRPWRKTRSYQQKQDETQSEIIDA